MSLENYLTGKKMVKGHKIKMALDLVRSMYEKTGGMGAIRSFLADTKDMNPYTVVEMDDRTGEIKVFLDADGKVCEYDHDPETEALPD